jgi:hypothetical protein
MRRYGSAIAVTALLLAAGFAAASIASGGGLRLLDTTGTTGTTSTVSHKQMLCHRTRSKKKPWVQITVDSHAVPAHLKHGDTLGACSQSQLAANKSKKSKKKSSSSSDSSSSSTSTSSSSQSNGKGNGNNNGQGNGGGNGNGNGNGKKK